MKQFLVIAIILQYSYLAHADETTTQGITKCPSAHPFAPAGMWMTGQCGRKLHIGNDIIYLHQSPANPTTHRLYVRFNKVIYSANTVLHNTNSNTLAKMSADAEHGFHVMIKDTINGIEGNYEYLICDDSVPERKNNQ